MAAVSSPSVWTLSRITSTVVVSAMLWWERRLRCDQKYKYISYNFILKIINHDCFVLCTFISGTCPSTMNMERYIEARNMESIMNMRDTEVKTEINNYKFAF